MAEFWIVQNVLPETPEIPAGYEMGLIDENNPAPEGAKVVSEDEVAAIVEGFEKEFVESVDAADKVQADLLDMDEDEFREAHSMVEVRSLADSMSIDSDGNKKAIVSRIYEYLGAGE